MREFSIYFALSKKYGQFVKSPRRMENSLARDHAARISFRASTNNHYGLMAGELPLATLVLPAQLKVSDR